MLSAFSVYELILKVRIKTKQLNPPTLTLLIVFSPTLSLSFRYWFIKFSLLL